MEQLNTSLAWAYYGYNLNNVLVQGFNVSFGYSGDGFYTKTNYSTWYVYIYKNIVKHYIHLYTYTTHKCPKLTYYIA